MNLLWKAFEKRFGVGMMVALLVATGLWGKFRFIEAANLGMAAGYVAYLLSTVIHRLELIAFTVRYGDEMKADAKKAEEDKPLTQ